MNESAIGVMIVGACGSVSLCTLIGATAQRLGLADETGMVSALPHFSGLDLPDQRRFVFGGWEIRSTTLAAAARELYEVTRSITRETLDAVTPALEAMESDISRGTAFGLEELLSRFDDAVFAQESAAEALSRLRADIADFKARHGLERVVVVNLASTEPAPRKVFESADELRKAVERDDREGLSPSVLYALAAVEEGCSFVNFTPSPGTDRPDLAQAAEEAGIVHVGKDGKTGETLLKTVLAPMFVMRNFRVLSWEGYNMLGNRDGLILDDPGSNAAKRANKDRVLRSIITDPDMHTRTRIDYVPSLDDWKVAWDYIHFEGFLGTRMSMSFLWQGCDSMLAAPLVLDLVRFVAFEAARGGRGLQKQLAPFFKNPIGVDEHDFHAQFDALVDFYRNS